MSGDGHTVTVDLWNVGQGDASSLRLPSGELVVIDVGPKNSALSQWLRAAPRGVIRDIILTHNDADHAGALTELVADPSVDVRRVLMLFHPDPSKSRQKALFRSVFDYSARRGFAVARLECPPSGSLVLWQDPAAGVALTLRHPAFTDNVLSRSPNDASAILSLDLNAEVLVVWPGDNLLARAGDVVGTSVHLLFGPHHGAPQDGNRLTIRAAIGALTPAECFVSVGTDNPYSHPSPKFVLDLADRGCRVNCTQMTGQCDRERVQRAEHVMDTSGYFGLPAPARGVFCRGHLRLSIGADGPSYDRYHDEHRKRLADEQSRGRRLLCLSRHAPQP